MRPKKIRTESKLRADGLFSKNKWHTAYPWGYDKRTFHTNVFDMACATKGISEMIERIEPGMRYKVDVIVTTYHPEKTVKP